MECILTTQQAPSLSPSLYFLSLPESKAPSMESAATPAEVPVIDFTGVDLARPGGERWEAIRSQVMAALESRTCFEAVFDKVSPELRHAFLKKGMDDVFGVPLELKKKNGSDDLPYFGYIGGNYSEYESLMIEDSTSPDGVRRFADILWPGVGNPSLCDTALSFSKELSELDKIVRRMILESYGVKHDLDSHIHCTTYKLRVARYEAPQVEGNTVLLDHLDTNLLSIVCQHQVEGLEVHNDGGWIHINPLPNSVSVLIGESMEALTNGRLKPTLHHVRTSSTERRYSAVLFAIPKEGYTVQPLKELVDQDHPALYKPFNFADWYRFRFSDSVFKQKSLKEYCGVEEGGIAA